MLGCWFIPGWVLPGVLGVDGGAVSFLEKWLVWIRQYLTDIATSAAMAAPIWLAISMLYRPVSFIGVWAAFIGGWRIVGIVTGRGR